MDRRFLPGIDGRRSALLLATSLATGLVIGVAMAPRPASAQVFFNNEPNDVVYTNNADITTGGDAIFIDTTGDNNEIDLTNTGELDAGDDGIYTHTDGAFADIEIDNSGEITAGGNAIQAYTSGQGSDVTITNEADLTSTGSHAIDVFIDGDDSEVEIDSVGDISAALHGVYVASRFNNSPIDIATEGTIDAGSDGFHVYSWGNNSEIEIDHTGDINSNGDGVFSYTLGTDSDLTVSVDGTITSATGDGIDVSTSGASSDLDVEAGAINAAGAGVAAYTASADSDIDVDVNGDIDSGLTGIYAQTVGDDSEITVEAEGITSDTGSGVYALTNGANSEIDVTVNGPIDAGYDGILAWTYGDASSVEIDAYADITAGRDGIYAWTYLADSEIDAYVDGNVTGGRYGINAYTEGADNSGVTVEVTGNVTGQSADGVYSYTLGDDSPIDVTIGGDLSGNGYGAFLWTSGEGSDISLDVGGDVTGTNYDGIFATTTGDSSGIDILVGGGVSGDGYGIFTYTTGEDAGISIEVAGNVTGDTYDGIFATTDDDDSPIDISVGGNVSGYNYGVYAGTTGEDSDIAVNVTGDVTGQNVDGIHAHTYGYNGVVDIDVGGSVTGGDDGIDVHTHEKYSDVYIDVAGDVTGDVFGIHAETHEKYSGVSINVAGDVTGESDDAINVLTEALDSPIDIYVGGNVWGFDDGIQATSTGANSGIGIDVVGDVYAYNENGIEADTDGDLSDIDITVGGDIDAGDDGIDAETTGLDSDITVRTYGDIYAYDGNGILATTDSGNVYALNTGAIDAFLDGVFVEAVGPLANGNARVIVNDAYSVTEDGVDVNAEKYSNVVVNGDVYSAGTDLVLGGEFGDTVDAGVEVYNGKYGVIDIGPDGSVTAASGLAIYARGGEIEINNEGYVGGRVFLTDDLDGDVFNNMAGGIFATGGISEFNDGDDVLNNAGIVDATGMGKYGNVAIFDSLEDFNNTGLVTLADDDPTDTLTTTGNFTAGPGSTLAVDAYLASPIDGDADGFFIGGSVYGDPTIVEVNVSGGDGTPNYDGIPVVVVGGTTDEDDFNLDAPINAGFFAWDLFLDGDTHELVTVGPGLGAYQMPVAVDGIQNIWHQSAGLFMDRQADLRLMMNGGASVSTADLLEPTEPAVAPPAPAASITPGVWLKALGVWGEQDGSTEYTALGRTYTFDLSYDQNIAGLIGGVDFGWDDLGPNSALLFGLMGGYLWSEMDFADGTDWTVEGGTVGAYMTYLNNGFFVDALLKADFLDVDVDAGTLGDDGNTDAVNWGVQVDTGYMFRFGSFFIEPGATLSWLNTDVDDLDIFGGTASFDEGDSLRGRLGVRIGAAFETASMTIAPDLTLSVWHDFDAGNEATISVPTATPFSVSSDGTETFGEVALGINAISIGTGWSGFARGSYQFGDDYNAGTAKAGFRYNW